jgi:hypothetical protein
MATLSLRANLVLAVTAAIAVAAAMGMPWYGAGPHASETASIDRLFDTVRLVFSDGGMTARDALGTENTLLAGLCGVMVVAAVLCLAAPVEDAGRTLLSLSSLAAVAVIAVKIFDQPGANAAVDLRYGIFVALAAAGLALSAAGAVAAKPKLRRPPARMVDLHAAGQARRGR